MATEGATVEARAPQADSPREAPVGLEEIVVIATRRETYLQDTPAAISAFDTSNYEDMALNHGTDFTLVVPSLSYMEFPQRLSIRGVGRTTNGLGLSPGVAAYRDGF